MNFLATSSYNYDTVANEVVRYACADDSAIRGHARADHQFATKKQVIIEKGKHHNFK